MRIEPNDTRGLRFCGAICKDIRVVRIRDDETLKVFAIEPQQIENGHSPSAVIEDAGTTSDNCFA